MKPLEALREYIRPLSVALLLFVLIAGAVTAGILEAVHPGKGVDFTRGVAGWFRAVPDSYYQLLGALGGLYIAAREYGKAKQVEATARYDPPPRTVDNPDP